LDPPRLLPLNGISWRATGFSSSLSLHPLTRKPSVCSYAFPLTFRSHLEPPYVPRDTQWLWLKTLAEALQTIVIQRRPVRFLPDFSQPLLPPHLGCLVPHESSSAQRPETKLFNLLYCFPYLVWCQGSIPWRTPHSLALFLLQSSASMMSFPSGNFASRTAQVLRVRVVSNSEFPNPTPL